MSLEDVEKIMDETAEAVKYQEVSIRDVLFSHQIGDRSLHTPTS